MRERKGRDRPMRSFSITALASGLVDTLLLHPSTFLVFREDALAMVSGEVRFNRDGVGIAISSLSKPRSVEPLLSFSVRPR